MHKEDPSLAQGDPTELAFEARLSRALQEDFGDDLASLEGKVSFQWFQERGLLKDLVTAYSGNIQAVLGLATRQSSTEVVTTDQDQDHGPHFERLSKGDLAGTRDTESLQERYWRISRIRLTSTQYRAGRAHFGLVDSDETTFKDAVKELFPEDLRRGAHINDVATIARNSFYGITRQKIQNAINLLSESGEPILLPLSSSQLEKLAEYSPETADFYRRLGEKHSGVTLEEIIVDKRRKKDPLSKISLTRNQYLSARARFRLSSEEGATFTETATELWPDKIAQGISPNELVRNANSGFVQTRGKIAALADFFETDDLTFPLNEQQLLRLEQVSEDAADLYRRIGERYPGVTLSEIQSGQVGRDKQALLNRRFVFTPRQYRAITTGLQLIDKPEDDESLALPTLDSSAYYFAKGKMASVFELVRDGEEEVRLPFTTDQLEKLKGISEDITSFYVNLGKRYPGMSLDELFTASTDEEIQRRSMRLSPQQYSAGLAYFGLTDKSYPTIREAILDLRADDVTQGANPDGLIQGMSRQFHKFVKGKMTAVFTFLAEEDQEVRLPLTDEHLARLGNELSPETADFFRRLGLKYPDMGINDLLAMMKTSEGGKTPMSREKMLLTLTTRQYQAALAGFRLIGEDTTAWIDVVREVCKEDVEKGTNLKGLAGTLLNTFNLSVRRKMRAILEHAGIDGHVGFPLSVSQFESVKSVSAEAADIFKLIGEKYHGLTFQEIYSLRREEMKDRSRYRPERKKSNIQKREQLQSISRDIGLPEELSTLEAPEFWDEFVADLTTLPAGEFTFKNFMQWFNPKTGVRPFYIEGKYAVIYSRLESYFYMRALQGEDAMSDLNLRERIAVGVFDKARVGFKALLMDKFPNDFAFLDEEFYSIAEQTLKEWTEHGLLPQTLHPLLKTAAHLPPDRQGKLIEALGTYIAAHQPENSTFDTNELPLFLKQVLKGYKAFDVTHLSPEFKVESLLRDFSGITELSDEARTGDNQEAIELLRVIDHEVLIPALISASYKPVSLFWNIHFSSRKDPRSTLAEDLDTFLVAFLKKRLVSAQVQPGRKKGYVFNPAFEDYFNHRILPEVRAHFENVVLSYQDIGFMRHRGQGEKQEHLFLHQLEGIQLLLDRGGGILSDEPGTGKTLLLALANLNLVERKRVEGKAHKRVLVVGSRTVVDNWEQELKEHIMEDAYQVINSNTPPNFGGDPRHQFKRLDEKTRVRTRLQAVKRGMVKQSGRTQFVLVNYDMFRDPFFKTLLEEFPFDSIIVDEAHHIKARNIELVKALSDGREIKSSATAARTIELYKFIHNNPSMAVFFATATPFVKEVAEPLILAHLTNPKEFPYERVAALAQDERAAHQALREVMVRRRKLEVADLPNKETRFVPIDLTQLHPAQQESFIKTAEMVLEQVGEHAFARFYALLSLESQAKLGWLKDTVTQLTQQGKKVVIFTPFVHDRDRYTAPISTLHLAQFLQGQGIDGVGILDGSLGLEDRDKVQKQFRLPLSTEHGLKVLVGNYQTAGESITLCSPENRATEVILFTGPNNIAKLIQAVDRVHRIGQTNDVTIHVPYVTGDILDREGGTYDEQVIRRLYGEIAQFEQVVDGLYFVEDTDVYKDIINGVGSQAVFSFEPETLAQQIRKTEHTDEEGAPRRRRRDPDRRLNWEKQSIDWLAQREEPWVQDQTKQYLSEISRHALLTTEEEIQLANTMSEGKQAKEVLNSKRAPHLTDELREQLTNQVKDGQQARERFINSNLRLVVSIALQYPNNNIPLLDRIQDGAFGLIRAVEDFDPGQGNKFGTYAFNWIKQAVTRAIADTSTTIRLPSYLRDDIRTAHRLAKEFDEQEGRKPSPKEWERLLIEQRKLNSDRAKNIVATIIGNIATPHSLEEPLYDKHRSETDTTRGDITADPEAQTENEVIEADLRREINDIFERVVRSRRERKIIKQHILVKEKTLEELGEEAGVTRERVRQIEKKSLGRLSEHKRLRQLWQEFTGQEKDYGVTLHSRNPENILFGDRRMSTKTGPLVEAIFTASPLQANVTYRKLYIGLTDAQVAREMEITEDSVRDHFARGRIAIWEQLFNGGINKSPLRNSIIYFPYIDPRVLYKRYEQNKGRLDTKTREILETYFGFNGEPGLFSLSQTSEYLMLKKTHVKRYLREGIKLLESV